MTWDELLAPGVSVRRSELESARFGRPMHRVTIGPGVVDGPGLLTMLDELDSDVVVVRYDAGRSEVAALLARSRRVVLPAGALTYWEKAVLAPGPVEGEVQVRGGAAMPRDDVERLVRDVVRSSFAGYGNHYTVDPLLDDEAALAGYEDWAARTLAEHPDDVLVLVDGGAPIGVATLERSADAVEILLAGLVPEAQGRRLYDVLLAGSELYARRRGIGRLVISTQVHNVRVQRAWARYGFRPFAAVETVHLVEAGLLAGTPVS